MGFDEFGNSYDTNFPTRKSVKWFEVPIQKFNAIIPHFVESLKTHQNNIIKLRRLQQWEEMRKEQISATQIVNQLASLLSEMENLRSQVTEGELIKFDRLISNSKQSAKITIRTYHDISSRPNCVLNSVHNHNSVETQDEVEVSKDEQLVAVADVTEAIKVQERRAVSMERLQEDIQDINYMFQELSQLVHEQGEAVEKVETHVETTHHNVVEGERMLCQAARYKNGMYPLLGAFLGTALGGPIGLVAGFKLGGLVAAGCGVLGFTGGKILKNQEEVSINAANAHREEVRLEA